MNKKDLLELNSIRRNLLEEVTIMCDLTMCLGNLLRSYARMETKEKRLELLYLVCGKMEDNFISMENIHKELSNFISKISCEK